MGIENLNQDDGAAVAAEDDSLKDALATDGDGDFVLEGEGGGAKKPSPALAIGLVLAVAAGGYLWHARSGPASAAAASPAADGSSQAVTKFLTGGTANVQMMEKMLRDTEKVVQQFLNYPSMKQVPLGELQTNPFRFRAPQVDGQPSASDALAKKKREEERQAVIKAVGTLNLQSVIHSGTRASCMINNTLYTEGQSVDSFVIERINPGTVVVKNGVYRFELRMQK